MSVSLSYCSDVISADSAFTGARCRKQVHLHSRRKQVHLDGQMLHLCWVYYFSKLSEFADTVFFVLRKKKSQITWLHLYHHSLTPFEAWVLVKFIAGGHGTFSNIVNNLVHVIMYGYYMVAAMGPQYQKYLWWKKHLTTLQLKPTFLLLKFYSYNLIVLSSTANTSAANVEPPIRIAPRLAAFLASELRLRKR
ncbi:hypothetical protein HW555_001609 [Spodoptera exigua]|uniref:Elongation of very long chain fatty acids protein n=1 Tax=Spodoptera exigua TaxID=7107 RepID=A0A835GTU2_SPOEX|nr:hypothetical protein HW555_001609 [Spodoptera exigua]